MDVQTQRKRRLTASIIGNVLEWYDFSVYSFLATTIGALFFSAKNSTTMLLQVFSVFALGYFVRFFGGIIFGHLGDRYGRSKALRFSMYLMGASTFAMGLLPTYNQVGIWATIALVVLRILQGLSAGGEYVSSTVYLYETSSAKKQTLWCSWVTFSCTIGVLAGSLVATWLHHHFTTDQINNGIWRIPYLLGILLALFGVIARKTLTETGDFIEYSSARRLATVPAVSAFKSSFTAMMQVIGLNIFVAVAFYGLFVWMPTYLHVFLGQAMEKSLLINTAIMIFLVLLMPLAGLLADATNRKRVALFSPLLIALFAYILFQEIVKASHQPFILFLILAIFALFFSLIEATTAAISASLFPIQHRLSGLGLAYNFSMSLFGGTTPLVCTYLITKMHSPLAPAIYITFAAIIGVIAIMSIRSLHSGVAYSADKEVELA